MPSEMKRETLEWGRHSFEIRYFRDGAVEIRVSRDGKLIEFSHYPAGAPLFEAEHTATARYSIVQPD